MNQKIEAFSGYDLEAQNIELWPFLTVLETFSEHYPKFSFKSDISCSPAICAFCVSLLWHSPAFLITI